MPLNLLVILDIYFNTLAVFISNRAYLTGTITRKKYFKRGLHEFKNKIFEKMETRFMIGVSPYLFFL